MSEEKCVCGVCEKCKGFENCCANTCDKCCCRKCPMMKYLVPLLGLLVIFCLGYCLGKFNNFKHNDWRGNSNCPMMVGQFKDFKNLSSDEAVVNVTPGVKPPTPQN